MSDPRYDYMSDPRYDYRPLPPRAALPEQNNGMVIVGAVAVLLVLGVIAYTMGGERLQQAAMESGNRNYRPQRARPDASGHSGAGHSQADPASRAGRAATLAGIACGLREPRESGAFFLTNCLRE